MFTLEQLAAAHAKVKTGQDFPRYVQEIKGLGLAYYDFFVTDGHSEYVARSGEMIAAPAKYASKTIAAEPKAEALRHTIAIHQQGQTDFMTFCQQAADAGVRYWRTDAVNLACIYVDMAGNEMVNEPIPDAAGYEAL
ncbi:hypothetical protein DTO96_100106 [Ephemeroptericola cinctiostellae]|uniref:Phage envelope protein n=1 Tax=Ephemeroptericola cinctiostellae TaxID=2268024 RepID=A0A345D7R5_9BURK|nr:DUF1398 family protein [Ephemeroptericola cinctiostellae]AXF84403.1 hypothetical protein DTO96_100106 [Ephemeroptericola cinctiostellae]